MVNILKFQALYSILSWPDFGFYAVASSNSGMPNSVDPVQTAPSGLSGSALYACTTLKETVVYKILGHLSYHTK